MGFKIRFIKTDNFRDDKFDDLVRRYGIIREPSSAHTQAQNDSAERRGRVIVTKARSLQINTQLPSNLWPEMVPSAALFANFTIRQLYTYQGPALENAIRR
jgi:hypothetical protein